MRLTPLLIGILIFSGLAVGFTAFFDGVLARHGTGFTDTEKTVLTQLDVTDRVRSNITDPLTNKLEGAEANPLGSLSFFIDSTIQGAKLMITLPQILGNILSSLVFLLSALSLPEWVAATITAVVGVTIVLMIVAAIMRWKL